jgi:hypothetical protein
MIVPHRSGGPEYRTQPGCPSHPRSRFRGLGRRRRAAATSMMRCTEGKEKRRGRKEEKKRRKAEREDGRFSKLLPSPVLAHRITRLSPTAVLVDRRALPCGTAELGSLARDPRGCWRPAIRLVRGRGVISVSRPPHLGSSTALTRERGRPTPALPGPSSSARFSSVVTGAFEVPGWRRAALVTRLTPARPTANPRRRRLSIPRPGGVDEERHGLQSVSEVWQYAGVMPPGSRGGSP